MLIKIAEFLTYLLVLFLDRCTCPENDLQERSSLGRRGATARSCPLNRHEWDVYRSENLKG